MDLTTRLIIDVAVLAVWIVILGVVFFSKRLRGQMKPDELRLAKVCLVPFAFIWAVEFAKDTWELVSR